MEQMRICQVVSGMLPIEQTGKRRWGAVEAIMDEYQKGMINLGHTSDIKWLNEVRAEDYDIIHIHVANLCIEARNRGLPYLYSNHDHSSFHLGRNSFNYGHQLEAVKGSIISFCHAEYVIDYFHDTDKLFYLEHGVDTSYYTPNNSINTKEHKLLMVANNGLCGDQGFDRKGFIYGIEAAKRLNLPITIVGASANQEFFEIHSHLLEYPKLTVISNNPTEEEKVRLFQEHTIFLHPSMLEYGVPCLTQMEAASCSLPVVGTYSGSRSIKGFHNIEKISTEEVLDGIILTMDRYDELKSAMIQDREKFDWRNICLKLEKFYKNVVTVNKEYTSEITTELYTNAYNKTINKNA